jgi:DNA-binding XRE family transcriptional regulator
MTDVLALAKERRARLAAELAKLDDFLRMAMALAEDSDGDDLADQADALGLGPEVEQDDELVLTDVLPKDTAALDIHVGKMIRYRRWMMGMTQEQLGEAVGLGLDDIQDYETGVRHVSSGALRKIAGAMDVPVSFFLDDFEEADPEGAEFFNSLLPDS